MEMYTLGGAQNLAKKRGKATCFWSPKGLSNAPSGHKRVYDPRGTIKEYSKPEHKKYSYIKVFDGKGRQVI